MKHLLLSVFLITFFISSAQHQDKVDFIKGSVLIIPDTKQETILGSVTYEFDVLANIDSVFLDAHYMEFSSVLLDYKQVKFHSRSNTISIYHKFQKGETHFLTLEYMANPKQTIYYIGWNDSIEGNEQVWTQGQGKYTSHWLPSFDAMEEKVEFDLNITVDEKYSVVANGKLMSKENQEPDAIMWSYDMQKPMSSYLLAFVIGDYKKQELKSASGIPIENYYYPQDSLRVEPTYRYTKEIFDFFEKEIGVAYPWQNYKQIPVHDFLYAGMENTGTTIFSDGYVIDSTAFVDKNYVNVNAHEMAHQWFGNLVTEKDGNHHWLHEGFATYYAYLAEKEIFGDDHFYWKLYETAEQLKNSSEKGNGQALTDPKASSLTFYEKGAWALVMLRSEIGDVAFKKGIQSYLNKYQFKNVRIQDFLNEMELSSGKSLSNFKTEWLENTEFPFENAKNLLAKQSSSIKLLTEMEVERKNSQSDDIDYTTYWNTSNSIHLKKYILEKHLSVLPNELILKAFESDTLPIRQTLLTSSGVLKMLSKEKMEEFLEDQSYLTIENALFALWQEYPKERSKYLNQTRNVIGLPNKNIRLMWLTLAILTDGYEARNTKQYFDELNGYTGVEYSFEVRQGAFFYLKEAFGFSDISLLNLIRATNHHSWQFRKYARNLLDEFLDDADYKIRIQRLSKELKSEELRYLNTKMNTE